MLSAKIFWKDILIDHSDNGKDQKVGDEDNDASVPLQKSRKRWVEHHTSERWFDQRPNVVIDS